MLTIEQFLERFQLPGIAVWQMRQQELADGYHFVIELDGIDHPKGAISTSQCEEFSRHFCEQIDQQLALPVTEREVELPADLHNENYSLEVSSAGAERQLRLPEELLRFQEQPLRVTYEQDGSRIKEKFLFVGRIEEDGVEYFSFEPYLSKRHKKGKAGRKGGVRETTRLTLAQIERVNLYLDF